MEAIIADIISGGIKNLLESGILKLILTLAVAIFGYKLAKMNEEREKKKIKEENEKKKNEDQAGIDIPNSNIEQDFQNSSDQIRDIFGDKK